jgi:hypothetical protein
MYSIIVSSIILLNGLGLAAMLLVSVLSVELSMKSSVERSTEVPMQQSQRTPQATDTPELSVVKQSMRAAAGNFLSTLRSVLVHSMAQGAASAAAVCADTAQTLTAQMGKQYGMELRRISLKARNAANVPTKREAQHLQVLEQMRSAGTLTDSTVLWDSFERDGVRVVQMIRPIVLSNGVCLQCHGKTGDVAPETASILNKRYPADRARGYAIGDVRGAVSVVRPVQ